jgi:hypothetical protein
VNPFRYLSVARLSANSMASLSFLFVLVAVLATVAGCGSANQSCVDSGGGLIPCWINPTGTMAQVEDQQRQRNAAVEAVSEIRQKCEAGDQAACIDYEQLYETARQSQQRQPLNCESWTDALGVAHTTCR